MNTWRYSGVAVFALVTGVLHAQPDTAELRKELDALKNDYESRIEALETRIRELEENQARPAPAPSSTAMRGGGSASSRVPAPPPEEKTADDETALRLEQSQRFRSPTEIREITTRGDWESPLGERIENVLEGFLDINGYFRAGYGRSDQDGPQRAFGIPGFAKYRLGNEAENYGELAFEKTFFPAGFFRGGPSAQDGPVAHMVYRLSFVNPYDDYGSSADTDFGAPELWGSIANVIPGMPDVKVWAGERFYRRHDIHINDFYFWDMSGGGGGIEDIPAGPGKLAFAWIGDGSESAIYSRAISPDPLNVAGFSKTNFDLRYYDWPFLGGKGEVGVVVSTTNSGVDSNGRQADDSTGAALSLVRTEEGFLDPQSLHKTSLQIGSGPAKTFTSSFETFSDATGTYIRPDPEESWRFRFTDQVVVKPADHFSVGGSFVYQFTDFGGNVDDQHWLSGGVRPIWHLNDVFSIALETGVDWVSDVPGGTGGTLGKITLAPQVSLGDQFFSRPVLRTFLTYALWDDDLKGSVGGPDYATETSGFTWGVQMESWW
ncbi:MAG: carbohydrate porin [Verrucomicrobiae bacterium]|nr:carbohydrate porin [Verrucomicrobiae bacterium]